jgi:translation initiation factor IF-2
MPTGPGPTRKDDGSHDASVDDIADLLVEEESRPMGVKSDTLLDKTLDDGLDVMLETPGPVLASTFLPPPPAPAGPGGDEAESAEDAGGGSNLAYEDLLAKLVLPAKAPEPEATLPAPEPLPVPEAFTAPPTPGVAEPAFPSISLPSSPSLQAAPPSEEQTLVTDNPLVAEEQQAAYREGRITTQPRIQDEMRPALTQPVPAVSVPKSKLLVLGVLLFSAGAVLATIIFKLIGSSSTVQAPPTAVAPPPVPQPTPAPPAQVKPLPPTPPVAAPTEQPAAAPTAAEPAEPVAPAAASAEEEPSVDEKAQARARKREAHRAPRPAPAPKAAAPAPAPKAAAPAPAPKAAPKAAAPAPAPAAKPAKAGKKGKGGSYADPFDN